MSATDTELHKVDTRQRDTFQVFKRMEQYERTMATDSGLITVVYDTIQSQLIQISELVGAEACG